MILPSRADTEVGVRLVARIVVDVEAVGVEVAHVDGVAVGGQQHRKMRLIPSGTPEVVRVR